MNADFDKAYKKLKLKLDDEHINHVKSFTKPGGHQISGKGTMNATSCKVFKVKSFTRNFREELLKLFNMETLESEEETETNDNIASQDHPNHSQSRNTKTLKVCSCCSYRSRETDEFKEHILEHPKCQQCGLHFKNEKDLTEHHKAFHAKVDCSKCGKLVLETNLKKHMNGHMMETGFKNVVSKGKVKASKAKDNEEGKTKKEPKLNGYRMFQKMTRPQVRNINPDATPQEMMVLLNAEWTKEKAAGRKGLWDIRAAQENNPGVADHADGMASASIPVLGSSNCHAIQRCELCGMMIANLNAHLLLAHRLDNGPGQVDIAEQVVVSNQGAESGRIADPDLVSVPEQVDDLLQVDGAGAVGETIDVDPPVRPEEDACPAEDVQQADALEPVSDLGAVDPDVGLRPVDRPFVEGSIVMVLRKSLHWPGKVLKITNKTFEVMIYDKARTTEQKHEKYILPFSTNISCCDGRGAAWVKAWKMAKAANDMRR